jgi:hypothetical protein
LSNGVNESLQAKTLTIADSDKLIVSMISGLRDLRQNGWQDVWREIEDKCQNLDLDASQFEKRRNAPKLQSTYIFFTTAGHRLPTHEKPEDHFRVELFLPVLDRTLAEMERRFSEQTLAITNSIQALLCPDSEKFLHFDLLKPFLSHYGETCGVVSSLPQAEMMIAADMIARQRSIELKSGNCASLTISDVIQLISHTPQAFINLMKCIQIAMTIPVTSVSCERSFSSMKFVKNALRSRTGDQRLSDLLTLHVCSERTRGLDIDTIVNCFADRPGRRLTF